MNIWKEISENEHENIRHKRLQTISDTRWTAKQTYVKIIFGFYGVVEDAMYPDIIIALSKISRKETIKPDIISKANNYY